MYFFKVLLQEVNLLIRHCDLYLMLSFLYFKFFVFKHNYFLLY